jgi:hypothetical protein
MPLTVQSSTSTEAVVEKSETSQFTVKLDECSYTFYHSDAQAPVEVQGWYVRIYHPQVGIKEFKIADIFQQSDQDQFLADITGTFAAFLANIS